jgi:amino acid adenylation domain-containing protein
MGPNIGRELKSVIMRNEFKDRPSNDYDRFSHQALDQSIGARFDEIVRRFPNKLAVRTKQYSWTYAELHSRAEQIAQEINRPELSYPTPILLLFDHDAPAIAAVLGVLKAGHFYCALDPSAPLRENGKIRQLLSPRAFLCDSAHLHLSEKIAEGTTPVLNADDTPMKSMDGALENHVRPSALAYVFFTSGTTGNRKGVMDSHRNVLHNILRYTNNLHITRDDRMTLLQTLSFSGSVSSLFCALLNGATVYPFDFRREGPAALADWISEQGITVYHSVPSIFRLIACEGHRFPNLRIIRLEGDQASAADAALFQRNFNASCLLVNGLGATECGIVRQFFLGTNSALPGRFLPIGYPVEDMEVAVLDEQGRPAPSGEVGEITVKSRYLAVGYWQQPDMTAAAFQPALNDPQARVYRTGDLGRFDEDSCLEYLGRKDFQEKVRGRRVSLGSIEAEFLVINGVREAVAAVVPDGEGENHIAVYFTEMEGRPVNLDEAWTCLRDRLDSSSLPSALIKVDFLPVNSNGKVDRRAFPYPYNRRMLSAPAVPPKTPIEFILAAIWKDILGLDQIGVDDSFFELGGDSLQLMRIFNRTRQVFHHEVSIGEFFAAPTVSGWAKIFESLDKTSAANLE